MGKSKGLAVWVALSLLASIVLTAAVLAADKKDDSAVIGLVDVEQILKGYEKKKQSDAEVQAFYKNLQDKFDIRNRNKLLTEAEMNELEALRGKDKPTDKEKARITELEDLEKARDNELRDLQAKKEPTDADKARLSELQALSKQSDEALSKRAKEYAAQVENKSVELGNAITKDVLEAIKQVAQEKGIATVVDKVAVLYGGVDITTPVLEKLNKKK